MAPSELEAICIVWCLLVFGVHLSTVFLLTLSRWVQIHLPVYTNKTGTISNLHLMKLSFSSLKKCKSSEMELWTIPIHVPLWWYYAIAKRKEKRQPYFYFQPCHLLHCEKESNSPRYSCIFESAISVCEVGLGRSLDQLWVSYKKRHGLLRRVCNKPRKPKWSLHLSKTYISLAYLPLNSKKDWLRL